MTSRKQAPIFILDISRLLSRAHCQAPTGIDRVELAYAQYLLQHHAGQTHFASYSRLGRIKILPRNLSASFIQALANEWYSGNYKNLRFANKLAYNLKIHLLTFHTTPHFLGPTFYLLLSHHHLMRLSVIRNFLIRYKAYFIPMVHDLIPLEYPEYARPREPFRHKARIKTVIELSKAVIAPTNTVSSALKKIFFHSNKKDIPIWTIPHGIHTKRHIRNTPKKIYKQPYFVYLSTIEPRKNHLMLLNLWRDMVKKRGEESVPLLVLIGKRGWENENILDLLDRSPALQHIVKEEKQLSDASVLTILEQANGLLFPSFTEGYGLPLAEAMHLHTPSICSDIPALKEVGGDIPYYIHPLDTLGWEKVIDDFTRCGPMWKKQKEKLKKHSSLTWEESIKNTIDNCSKLLF